MNTDELKYLPSGLLPNRKFSKPQHVKLQASFNNEYFKDGKIYCWMGSAGEHQRLVEVDERTFQVEKETNIPGYCVVHVGNNDVLFECDDESALLVDRASLIVKGSPIKIPKDLLSIFKRDESELVCRFKIGDGFGLFDWPSMNVIWEHENQGRICSHQIVHDGFLFLVNYKGIRKIDVSNGLLVWEKPSNDWMSDSSFPKSRIVKNLKIRSEATAIVADTLALSLDPMVMAGIDIHTGNVRWAIDIAGPQKLRVTKDGIGWFFREGSIYRLDIAKGELLPPIPVQFSPVLEKPANAQLGAFDMSTTHIIAEVSMRTSAGYTVGHIVGIRRDNGVCEWAVPIEGFVTKLYLLNNRIYATGTFAGADIKTPSSKTLIIEGEGGYIPD